MTLVAGRLTRREPPGALPGIVLEPSELDHRLDGARYARLATVLRDQGWDPRVEINHAERRSAVTELVVRLLDEPPGVFVDALAASLAEHVRKSLARRRKERGRVVIYNATGSVLRIVEVEGPTPDPSRGERRRAHKRV